MYSQKSPFWMLGATPQILRRRPLIWSNQGFWNQSFMCPKYSQSGLDLKIFEMGWIVILNHFKNNLKP
jgi:hypothetical protein